MTVLTKLGSALDQFCASWPDWNRRSAQTQASTKRLVGYLVSIPIVSLLNLATNPLALSSNTYAFLLVSLSIAVPMMAIAVLIRTQSERVRDWMTIALAPGAFILITQGNLNTVGISLLLFGILASEAVKTRVARVHLAVSSFLTLSLASICLAATLNVPSLNVPSLNVPSLLDLPSQLAAIWGLTPALLAGFFFLSVDAAEEPKLEASSQSQFDIAAMVAQETGAVVLEIDQKARVLNTSQNAFDVLALDQIALRRGAFVDHVHIADKVVLLSQLDAAAQGVASARFKIRIKTGVKGPSNTISWMSANCRVIANADCLMLIIDADDQPKSLLLENAGGVSKSALTIVSHELRTPLNAIIGFSDLMAKGLAGEIANEGQREYIGLIHQSGQHLLELVNSILDISKLENGTFELTQADFLPQQAAEFAISMLSTQALNKEIGLSFMPLCGLDEFSGDKRVTQQIIINLLSNAVKFTQNRGHIDLKIDMDGTRLMITVRDTGVGMSKEELGKVGTPFYQASSNLSRMQEGSGLGLSLVRQLATKHGGAIEISSELGKGTTVRVALAPLTKKETVVSYLKHKEADESLRFIQINEELDHGPLRKTA